MQLNKLAVMISFFVLLYLLNEFLELGWFNHKLLNVLIELIVLLYLLILLKYKKEIYQITKFYIYQKKLEDYFTKK